MASMEGKKYVIEFYKVSGLSEYKEFAETNQIICLQLVTRQNKITKKVKEKTDSLPSLPRQESAPVKKAEVAKEKSEEVSVSMKRERGKTASSKRGSKELKRDSKHKTLSRSISSSDMDSLRSWKFQKQRMIITFLTKWLDISDVQQNMELVKLGADLQNFISLLIKNHKEIHISLLNERIEKLLQEKVPAKEARQRSSIVFNDVNVFEWTARDFAKRKKKFCAGFSFLGFLLLFFKRYNHS